MRNVLVTVTRYFGGAKLGTGGLVRAYGDCARQALENTPTVEVRPEVAYRLLVPYEFYDGLVRVLNNWDCRREGEEFGEEVSLIVRLPKEGHERRLAEIQNLCRGRCQLEPLT